MKEVTRNIRIEKKENLPLMSKKQILGIAILVCSVVGYVAFFTIFSNNNSNELVEVYFADRMTKAHLMLIDNFNHIHNGQIKIVPIHFPQSEFSTDMRKEVLARSLRGDDDAIDIFAVDIIGVDRFAKWSEPLDQYFSTEEKQKILPIAIQTCYIDSALMAIPLDLVQSVMYYREDLLKKSKKGNELIAKLQAGITWEEFRDFGVKMKSKNPFYIFPASDYEGLICSYIENLLSLKPDYFETNGFKFTTPEARRALQILVDLVQTYRLTPLVVTSFIETSSYQYFIENDGLFIRGWTIYDTDYADDPVDKNKERYLRKAMIPHPAGGKPASIFGGWNLMVAKSSKKKNEAIKFIKFLLSDESQEIIYKHGGYYPVVRSFFEDSVYSAKYPEINLIREFVKHGVFRPKEENYTKYSLIMARYFSLAIAGKISVDGALRETQNAIDAELRQRRED